nr:hypothetical protein [Williamsia sterculiae]
MCQTAALPAGKKAVSPARSVNERSSSVTSTAPESTCTTSSQPNSQRNVPAEHSQTTKDNWLSAEFDQAAHLATGSPAMIHSGWIGESAITSSDGRCTIREFPSTLPAPCQSVLT